jgi:hypothetical protein
VIKSSKIREEEREREREKERERERERERETRKGKDRRQETFTKQIKDGFFAKLCLQTLTLALHKNERERHTEIER